MRLVFASNNAHKLQEVQAIMPAGIIVLSLHEVGFEQEIDETGTTLAENSKIKADTVYQWLKANGKWSDVDGVFADDTGLEIDALNGAPGVYTARWYKMEPTFEKKDGEAGTFSANRAKALWMLRDKTDRGAQFKTVVTIIKAKGEWAKGRMDESSYGPVDECLQVEGVVRGQISDAEYGNGGFGYDPVFIPEGYDKTFAELPAEVKNSISHRGRAMMKLVELL